MTYQTFVASHPDPILQQSDETVQNGVYNWFKYRRIGFSDESKFLDILQRNVAINYPIYKQKLRIEPGVANYDWLVSEYRERQLKSTGENGNTRTHGNDTTTTETAENGSEELTRNLTSSNIRTGGQTAIKTGTTSVGYDTTVTDSKTGDDITKDQGTETIAKTGKDITAETGTDAHAKGGTDTVRNTGTDTHLKTGTESVKGSKSGTSTHTGGSTETDVAGLHTTTNAPHVKTVTVNDSGSAEHTGEKALQGALPLSENYDTFNGKNTTIDTGDGVVGTNAQQAGEVDADMPTTMNWLTATGQSQTTHHSYNNESRKQVASYEYDDGVEGDINTTTGDKDNPDTKTIVYNDDKTATAEEDSSATTYNVSDADTKNLEQATTYGGTDTETRDLQSATTYDTVETSTKDLTHDVTYGSTDTTEKTGTDTTTYDTTDKLTYDKLTDTGSEGGTQTTTKDEKTSATVNSIYGNITDSATEKHTDREQVTGRNQAPAELLARATAFIEQSSAFMWFKEQIDSCFYPGYYSDEDCNDNEYGSAFI